MCRKNFLIVILMFFGFVCFAQSSDFVSYMIDAEKVSYEDVAYFCAINLNLVDEDCTPADALKALADADVYSTSKDSKANISYQALAKMCMNTWNLKRGFMYNISKLERYAFKDMQAMGFIPDNASPTAEVSGLEVLYLINRCLEVSGE